MSARKLVRMVKRRPGLALAGFLDDWRALGARLATAPGIRDYVQSVPAPRAYRSGEPLFDGIEELAFADLASLRTGLTDAAMTPLARERAGFEDPARSREVVVVEHVVKSSPLPQAPLKSIELVHRRPGLDADRFRRHWREVHAPIAAAIPVLLRYVQCHPCTETYADAAPPFDGLAFTWFADIDAMRASAKSPEYARTRADEPNFVAPDLASLITSERRFDFE